MRNPAFADSPEDGVSGVSDETRTDRLEAPRNRGDLGACPIPGEMGALRCMPEKRSVVCGKHSQRR